MSVQRKRVELETFPPFQKLERTRKRFLGGGVPALRHGISFVCASDIANQYYCEMEVDLRYRLGERPSEIMEAGVEAHEDLLKEAEKTQHVKLWDKIALGEGLYACTLILAECNDIPIPGKPDWILFRDRKPILVFEFKFRTGRIRPYNSDHIQAGVYSWILKELGFDTTGLKYVLVIAPQLCKECEKKRRMHEFAVKIIGTGANRKKICECLEVHGKEPWVYIYDPDYAKIEKEIRWALGYWRDERNPIPTSKRNKCKRCAYRDECAAPKPAEKLDTFLTKK